MIVTDVEQSLMFGINPIGSLIWQKLTEGASPDEVAHKLASECSISEDQALSDVSEFLNEIENLRLLRSCKERTDQAQASHPGSQLLQRLRARICPKTAA
jgi:hypothetical protein